MIILFHLLFLSFIFPLNLTLHDYDNPSANHILDIELQDERDLLIVSGMLGGIEFYDISSPQNLNHLDNLQLSGGGGGGGQGGGTKPNCIVSFGDYAYVTTNRGLGVIDISILFSLFLLIPYLIHFGLITFFEILSQYIFSLDKPWP